MFSRRDLLKFCPLWLALPLGLRAAPTPAPMVQLSPPKPAPTRNEIIEHAAAVLVQWMETLNWVPRTSVSICDNVTFCDRIPRIPERTDMLSNLTPCPLPPLPEFKALFADSTWDGEELFVFRDLFRAMCRRYTFGPVVTNEDVNPGEHNCVRYTTPRYIKDVDELRSFKSLDVALLVICGALKDLLAVPDREVAPILELDLYVRREAFMIEFMAWTSQMLPYAVLTLTGAPESFTYTRSGVSHWLAQFFVKYGRPPKLMLINNRTLSSMTPWLAHSILSIFPMPGMPNTPVTPTEMLCYKFKKDFGVELRVFNYSSKPGDDNDTRIIG